MRGDAATGRVTFPIAYPSLSRAATAFFLIVWSWCASRTWQLDQFSAAALGVLALFVGVQFVVRTGARADKISFYWYNVSPPSTAVLFDLSHPAFSRFGLVLPIYFLHIIVYI
jgi:hypothetical protein